MQILLTEDLARAILRMDEIAWNEGLGPETPGEQAEWDGLLESVAAAFGLKPDCRPDPRPSPLAPDPSD